MDKKEIMSSDTAAKLKENTQVATKKAKGFISEFKTFATKGSAMQLAVGVVLGTAFNAIVTSLVESIITPLLSIVIGHINISELSLTIKSGIEGWKDITFPYGKFLQASLNFLTIAFFLFLFLKMLDKLSFKKEPEEKPAPEPTESEKLLTEIRDILRDGPAAASAAAQCDGGAAPDTAPAQDTPEE
jgi:large conductance mechanosensitive channel